MQFRVTITTNCRVLTRVNVNYAVGHERSTDRLIVYRVYSARTDVLTA
jgi:hypothetical protein